MITTNIKIIKRSPHKINIIFTLCVVLYSFNSFSQGVGVNNDGSMPETGTMLDIKGATDDNTSFGIKVKNSSGNEIMVVRSEGNVGIGTATPGSRLEISNTADNNNFIYSTTGANGRFALGTDASANVLFRTFNSVDLRMGVGTADDITIKNGGNVGIGTTSPNYGLHLHNPFAASGILNVSGTGSGYTHAATLMTSTDDYRGSGHYMEITESGQEATWYTGTPYSGTGNFQLGYFANDFAGGGNAAADDANAVMTVTEASNVGIGTTSPSGKLHIDQNAGAIGLRVNGGSGGNDIARFTRDVGASGIIGISSSGADPQIRLDNETTSGVWAIGNDSGTDNFVFAANNTLGTNDRVVIQQDGNVGIGASSPKAKLDLGNSGDAVLVLNPGSAAGLTYTGFTHNDLIMGSFLSGGYSQGFISTGYTADVNRKFHIGSSNSATFNGAAAFVPHFTVMSGGNVGIGNSSPGYKLDVTGTAHVDGLNVNGAYSLPTADGTADYVLKTNGSGAVTWADADGLVNGDNLGNHTATTTLNMDGNDIDMVNGQGRIHTLGEISFDWTAAGNYDSPANHGIQSRNEAGAWGDELRINSYNDVITTIDANNNDGTSYFKVQEHSTADGTDLFWVSSPSGNGYHSGNLGIGTTAPLTKVHAEGTQIASFTGTTRGIMSLSAPYVASNYAPIDFLYTTNANPTARIAAFHDGGGSKLMFGTSNNFASGITNTAVTINALGNVGIGNTSPTDKLQIDYNSGASLTGTSAYGGIHLSQTGGNDDFVGITSSATSTGTTQGGILFQGSGGYGSKIHFLTTSSYAAGMQQRMIIDHFGNVGIGNTAPSEELHVTGDARITGLGGSGTRMVVTDNNGVLSQQAIPTGDITGVTAGDGLTGGGSSGALTLNVVARNGLTDNANDIELGGPLDENTTITQGNYNWDINLNGTGDFSIQNAGVDALFVEGGSGEIGINDASPSYPLDVYDTPAGNTGDNTIRVDVNGQAATISGANRTHTGLYVDYDASNIVGTTTNGSRHYAYGIRGEATAGGTTRGYDYRGMYGSAVHNASGDMQVLSGVHGYGTTNNNAASSGNVATIRGIYGEGRVNASSTGTVTNLYGTHSYAYNNNSTLLSNARGVYGYVNNAGGGTLTNAYGNYGLVQNNSTSTISNAYGVYAHVNQDDAGGNINNSFAVYARQDQDGGTSGTAYLYYGIYQGAHTTQWGLHLNGETKNYLSGDLGIGTTTPARKLHVYGASGNYPARVSSPDGYLDFGPANTGWCHFGTDRANYYFNKGIHVDGGVIGSYNTNNLSLHTGGTTRITVLNSNGNVGIGNTAPSEKLHVSGDARITGLGGSGTRMVVTDNNGVLSQQAIPTGDITNVTAGTGMVGGGGSGSVTLDVIGTNGVSANANDIEWGGALTKSTFITQTTHNVIFNKTSGNFQVRNSSLPVSDPAFYQLFVASGGNVGLGMNDPAQKLEVNGNVMLSGGDRQLRVETGYLDVRPADASHGLILRDYTGGSTIWSGFRTINAGTDYLHIAMNSTSLSEGIMVSDNGNVGIGDNSPSQKLEVNGRVKSNGINETSDARLKKDITTLNNSLEKIMSLRGVSYKWKSPKELEKENIDPALSPKAKRVEIGLIAQELEKTFPELVDTDSDGYKSVQYSKVVAVLIEAVKDQQKTINDLKTENNSQTNLYKQQQEELNEIKALLGIESKK